MRAIAFMAAVISVCGFARHAGAQSLRVAEVVGATSDAYEMASWCDRIVVATSGGVMLLRHGRVERTLTVRDGLPGMRFRSVSVVDRDAWVGGPDGAARIECDAHDQVRVADRLAIARVTRVVARSGRLYFATAGGGLVRVDRSAARSNDTSNATTPVVLGHSPAFMHVTDLAIEGERLWASTAGAGLVRLDASDRVDARITARDGIEPFVWRLSLREDRLVAATANGVAVVRHGRLDAGAPESLARGDLRIPDVRGLSLTPAGLYVTAYGAGAFRFESHPRRFVALGSDVPANARDVLIAADGAYVSHPAGLERIGPAGVESLLVAGLPSSDITTLDEAFGSLWIGTFDRGLARRDADGTFHAVSEAHTRWSVDLRINDLARTGASGDSERLWIATDRGLFVHDGRSFVPVIEPQSPGRTHVTALHVDPRGDLWVAGSEGLFHRVGATGEWIRYAAETSLPLQPLDAVCMDDHGVVWAGGLHGLFTFDPSTRRFARHTVSRGELPVDWITAVIPTRDGVAIGTYHGGLVWWDGERFTAEREGTGLPSGWVNPHAMRRVGDYVLYGALDRGLVVGRRGHWRAITLNDGLPGNDVTAILGSGDGNVWIGTRGGLARIEIR